MEDLDRPIVQQGGGFLQGIGIREVLFFSLSIALIGTAIGLSLNLIEKWNRLGQAPVGDYYDSLLFTALCINYLLIYVNSRVSVKASPIYKEQIIIYTIIGYPGICVFMLLSTFRDVAK